VRLGFADQVAQLYAGDLHGQLWKLDFSATSANDWSLSNLSFFKNGSTAIPMYVARDGASSSSNRQPITMEPALIFGPARSILVSFGTGKFLETSDVAGPYKAQSVYTLLDNGSAVADTNSGPTAAISGRARLSQATVTASAGTLGIATADFVWGRPDDDSDAERSGWYFDFLGSAGTTTPSVTPGSGERQISNFGVLSGKLIFGSVVPPLTSCDAGDGNLYILDVRTGDGDALDSGVGIPGEPFLAQVGASTLTKSNTTGARTETTRYQVILQGSSGLAAPPSLSRTYASQVGRLSWREISNYQDVRNAP
jgi:type IV pilus assembly protein PilY1